MTQPVDLVAVAAIRNHLVALGEPVATADRLAHELAAGPNVEKIVEGISKGRRKPDPAMLDALTNPTLRTLR